MRSADSVSGPLAYWPQSPTHRPAVGDPARTFFCQACRLSCSGPEPWRQHLESGRHMKLDADLRERMGARPAVPVAASSPAGGGGSSSNLCPPGTAFFCEACQLSCTGPAPWREHQRSAKHLKKVSQQERAVTGSRLTGSQPPSRPGSSLSVEDVLRSDGSPVAAGGSLPPLVSAVTGNSFYCDICRLSCSGPEPWKQHVQSAKHLKKKNQAEMMATLPANGSTYDGVSAAVAFNDQTSSISSSSMDPMDSSESPSAVASDSAPLGTLSTPTSAVGGPFYCDACRVHCSGQEPWRQHVQSAKHLKMTSQPGGGPSAPVQTPACSPAGLTRPEPQSSPAVPGGWPEPADRPSPTGSPAVPAGAGRSCPPAAASPGPSTGWGWPLQLPAGSPQSDRASPPPARHDVADLSGTSSDVVSGRSTPLSASLGDSSQFRCDICQLTCTGPEPLRQHVHGEKHKKMAVRRLGVHTGFPSVDTVDGPAGRVLTPTPTLTPSPLLSAAADVPPFGVCADAVCGPVTEPGRALSPEVAAVCRSIRVGSSLYDLLDRKDGISQEHTATADQHLRQLHVEGLVAFLEDIPLIRHNQPFSRTRC